MTSLSGFTIFWALHELRLRIKVGDREFVGNLEQNTSTSKCRYGFIFSL